MNTTCCPYADGADEIAPRANHEIAAFASSKDLTQSIHHLVSSGLLSPAQVPTFDGSSASQHKLSQIFQSQPSVYSAATSQAIKFGTKELDEIFPYGAFSCGAIHECCCERPPIGLLSLLVGNFVKEQQANKAAPKFILWIGKKIWPTPYILSKTGCLAQHGRYQNCLFIDPPNNASTLWAINFALQSPTVGAVVAFQDKLSLQLSRKLSLSARKGGAICFLLRPEHIKTGLFSSRSRWLIAPSPSPSQHPRFQLELTQCKGFQPKQRSWIIELVEDNSYASAKSTLSVRIPPTLADSKNSKAPQLSTAAPPYLKANAAA